MKTLEEINKQIADLKQKSQELVQNANKQLEEYSKEILRLEGELRIVKDLPIE